jgi:hypothetical protein
MKREESPLPIPVRGFFRIHLPTQLSRPYGGDHNNENDEGHTMKTATLVLPGGMNDYLADTNIWNEDYDAGSVATVNALNNGKLRRYGKGYTVTIEVTKAVADVLGTYADTILASGDEWTPAERKAAQVTFDRLEALIFTEKETEPTTETETTPEPQPETKEEAAVRKSVDAQFPVVAAFLADERAADEPVSDDPRGKEWMGRTIGDTVTVKFDGRVFETELGGADHITPGWLVEYIEADGERTGSYVAITEKEIVKDEPVSSSRTDDAGRVHMASEKPKTKAAKNLKRGDWIKAGSLAFQVGQDAVDNGDGTVFVAIGHSGSEYRANERVTMHYDD